MPTQEVVIELTEQQQEQIKQATGKSIATVKFTSDGASSSSTGANEQDGLVMEF
jgi:hypothetical protein